MPDSKERTDLFEKDVQRLEIRAEYKKQMIAGKTQDASLELPDSYVYFPMSIISPDNTQLRKGLSWLSNGFVVKQGRDVIAVDPGVGFVHRLTESGYDLNQVTDLFVSHMHLDHSADANTLMDWKIRARDNTKVYAPKSVFQSQTISDFHSGLTSRFPVHHSAHVLNFDDSANLLDNKLTFVELHHGVECAGFMLQGVKKIAYVSDTGYALELNGDTDIDEVATPQKDATISKSRLSIKEYVSVADVLVVNIDSFVHNKNSKTHLSVTDLLDILAGSNISQVVIAHVSPLGELDYNEWAGKLAEYVETKSGIATFAPNVDGLLLNL